jgi:hypothetical protein
VRAAWALRVTLAWTAKGPASAGAQNTTPWGDPDLQGIWTNQTPVPLERPEGLAGKAFFTKEEAAEFERAAVARLLGLTAAQVPFSGELNEIWLETQEGRVPNRRTSLVIDPPDGRISYTPEGRKRWDSAPSIERVMDSRGRWDGRTLVVETTNFNDKRLFRGATRQLRLVERFTRLDADTIDYQLSVTDPATFATAWTLQNSLRRKENRLFEVACHEGNYGLAGILSGARAQERVAREP